jgi:hypothetical protein
MAEERRTPDQEIRRLYEEAEGRTAQAMEEVVGSSSFGELLAMATGNVMGILRIGNESLDLVVRNLRVAGRQDLVKLGRQLARTEDKLEMVLQEVEHLQGEVRALREATASREDPTPAQKRSASREDSAPAERRSASGEDSPPAGKRPSNRGARGKADNGGTGRRRSQARSSESQARSSG